MRFIAKFFYTPGMVNVMAYITSLKWVLGRGEACFVKTVPLKSLLPSHLNPVYKLLLMSFKLLLQDT